MSLFVGVNICLWYVPWILLFNTDTSHWTFICSVNCERMRTGVMPSPNSPYHINVWLLCLKGAESDLCGSASVHLVTPVGTTNFLLSAIGRTPWPGCHVTCAQLPHLFSSLASPASFLISHRKKPTLPSRATQLWALVLITQYMGGQNRLN